MSEMDFQREVLARLGHMEADIKGLKTELSGWKDRLGERCENRSRELNLLWGKQETLFKRVDALETLEHQRKGGVAVVGALLAVAGAIGGLVARFFG